MMDIKSRLILNAHQNKRLYIFIALIIIGSGGAYAYHSEQQPVKMFNVPTVSTYTEKAKNVDNLIDNMLSGSVTAGKAHDYIFDEKFFAKQDGETLSGAELSQNQGYVTYLNAADDVVSAFVYNASPAELEAKKQKMKEKEHLI